MTQLDTALQQLVNDYSQKAEAAFETALRDTHIYIIQDFSIATDDGNTIIPVFSNDRYAEEMGVIDSPIHVQFLRDLTLKPGYEIVINPMHEAISLDSSMLELIFDENPEVSIKPADNTALMVIFTLKDRLDAYGDITAASLGILQTGRRSEFVVIIDGVEEETALREIAETLLADINAPLPVDLYPRNSELGQAIANITKPFYTK